MRLAEPPHAFRRHDPAKLCFASRDSVAASLPDAPFMAGGFSERTGAIRLLDAGPEPGRSQWLFSTVPSAFQTLQRNIRAFIEKFSYVPTFTNCFPIFFPSSIRINAWGAFSSPSTTSSR